MSVSFRLLLVCSILLAGVHSQQQDSFIGSLTALLEQYLKATQTQQEQLQPDQQQQHHQHQQPPSSGNPNDESFGQYGHEQPAAGHGQQQSPGAYGYNQSPALYGYQGNPIFGASHGDGVGNPGYSNTNFVPSGGGQDYSGDDQEALGGNPEYSPANQGRNPEHSSTSQGENPEYSPTHLGGPVGDQKHATSNKGTAVGNQGYSGRNPTNLGEDYGLLGGTPGYSGTTGQSYGRNPGHPTGYQGYPLTNQGGYPEGIPGYLDGSYGTLGQPSASTGIPQTRLRPTEGGNVYSSSSQANPVRSREPLGPAAKKEEPSTTATDGDGYFAYDPGEASNVGFLSENPGVAVLRENPLFRATLFEKNETEDADVNGSDVIVSTTSKTMIVDIPAKEESVQVKARLTNS